MDAQEVDGYPRQSDGNANQRIDGVTVERHSHQENSAKTKHHRVQQGQLQMVKWRERDDRQQNLSLCFIFENIVTEPYTT